MTRRLFVIPSASSCENPRGDSGLLWACLLAMVVGCFPLCHVYAAGTPPPFEEYGITLDRNIFDPDRYRPAPPAKPPPEAPPTLPAKDYVLLTGVLLEDDAVIAFIASSRTEWGGAFTLTPGQEIGPGKVIDADTTGITLTINETTLHWPVGTQLDKGDAGWRAAEGQAPAPPAEQAKPTSDAASEASGASDLLKQLMERRRKESKE